MLIYDNLKLELRKDVLSKLRLQLLEKNELARKGRNIFRLDLAEASVAGGTGPFQKLRLETFVRGPYVSFVFVVVVVGV